MIKSALTHALGRLPIGWMQLQHNKTRLVSAVGGVTFANVLIFMQLGFMGALFETSVMTHRSFNADIIIASSDYQSIRQINTLPRSRMLQALAIDGVESIVPVYLATIAWTDPETQKTINFRVIGAPVDHPIFVNPQLNEDVASLRVTETALVDRLSRQLRATVVEQIKSEQPHEIELGSKTLHLSGVFAQGASFDVDGTLIVSEQTFFLLFPRRSPGTPTLLFAQVAPTVDPEIVAAKMNLAFPENDARALTKEQFIQIEQDWQATQSPIGFVFSFGVVIGLIVGLVIVYQVLTTDVQDHLAEYATFKAIGYPQPYFLGIVFEEAFSLAALGFIPGLLLSLFLYNLAANATELPIAMPVSRPVLVFTLTVLMCAVSGAIATRRLASAQPADLF